MKSRSDRTQAAIVKELRARYYSVLIVSNLHIGFDIAVGWAGNTYLYEIKNHDDPPSRKRLTKNEQEFKDKWRGHIRTVETVEEIIMDMEGKF